MKYFRKSKYHINTLLVFTALLLLPAIVNETYSQIEKVDTVGTTWQISRGLDFANHQYTDVPVYNANGSMALFIDAIDIAYSQSLNDFMPL